MTQKVIVHGPYSRAKAVKLVEGAPDGAIVSVSPPRRSDEQNALMWASLSEISRAKPEGRNYAPEIWKCLFMAACGHQVRWEPALDGAGVVAAGFRSSRLTKAEMSDLIECINSYAAEHGVTLSQAA